MKTKPLATLALHYQADMDTLHQLTHTLRHLEFIFLK